MSDYHIPVLLKESVNGLAIKPEGIYVDLTFGGGGHSREILSRLTTGKLIAFDRDVTAESNIIEDKNLIFVNHNYRFITNFLEYHGYPQVDGILADLGVSSHHFDNTERGFSFRSDAELDMRMNKSSSLTAKNIINDYSEEDLASVLFHYGELRSSRAIARKIAQARQDSTINTTFELTNLIGSFAKRNKENRFFSQVFQALRIEVNSELKSLEEMLLQTAGVLKQGGRLSVITYHSLEDRLVKNYMRSGNLKGEVETDIYGQRNTPFKLVNRKVITSPEDELEVNNRARSAKLRIAEKI